MFLRLLPAIGFSTVAPIRSAGGVTLAEWNVSKIFREISHFRSFVQARLQVSNYIALHESSRFDTRLSFHVRALKRKRSPE